MCIRIMPYEILVDLIEEIKALKISCVDMLMLLVLETGYLINSL